MRDMLAGLVLVISSVSASYAGDHAVTTAATATPAHPAAPDAAAARHAKRIACRKEASDQKLIGADKLEFIKECIKKPAAAKP